MTGLLWAQILKEIVNAAMKTWIGGAWFGYGEIKVFLAGVFMSRHLDKCTVFVVLSADDVKHYFALSKGPWQTLESRHYALEIALFHRIFDIHIRHQLPWPSYDFDVLIARKYFGKFLENDDIGDDAPKGLIFLLFVKQPFVWLIILYLPSIILSLRLIKNRQLVVEVLENLFVHHRQFDLV